MERKLSRRQARSRSGILRALTALAVIALTIALTPVAFATSLVPDSEAFTRSSADPGPQSTAIEAAEEAQLEILSREYNWWDLWGTPSNTTVFAGDDADHLFTQMERNPGMYTHSGDSDIISGFDGSNTMSDYRSPGYGAASARESYSTPSEGFTPGHISNQDSAIEGDRGDVIAKLRSASNPSPAGVESGGTASSASSWSASDFQFIEENVLFGSVDSSTSGPDEDLNDFRFIEENTLLPGGNGSGGSVAPDNTGWNEHDY